MRISATKTVLGIVIEPDWDDDDFAAELVWSLAEHMQGFVFAADNVFHYDDTPLLGPAANA